MSKRVPLSLIVTLLAVILPHLGLTIGTDQITTTVQVVVSVISSLVILAEHKDVVSQARLGGHYNN